MTTQIGETLMNIPQAWQMIAALTATRRTLEEPSTFVRGNIKMAQPRSQHARCPSTMTIVVFSELRGSVAVDWCKTLGQISTRIHSLFFDKQKRLQNILSGYLSTGQESHAIH